MVALFTSGLTICETGTSALPGHHPRWRPWSVTPLDRRPRNVWRHSRPALKDVHNKVPSDKCPIKLPPQRRCWNCDAVKKKPECSFPHNYRQSKYVAWPPGLEPPASGASKAEQERWISHAEIAYPSTMKYRAAKRLNHEAAKTALEVDG